MTTNAERSSRFDELTPAQSLFAQEKQATPGHRAERYDMVFLYRETGSSTQRWLIDPKGRVADSVTFHRTPAQHV
jgi:hypothetical protein